MTIDLDKVGGIYFITFAEDNRYLKIGRTKLFSNRLKTYITHSPFTIDVQLLLPSEKASFDIAPQSYIEREFHRQYNHLQHKNEWFLYTEELRKDIHALRSKYSFEPFLFQ
jgi:hypothetical protein